MLSSTRLKLVLKAAVLVTFALRTQAFAQQAPHDGFFTTSDGVKLHYLEAGQGETLLFIPGWLMPADIWEEQIKDLSQDYHVVALDPRSQGQSDMTPQGNDPFRRSKDLQELLDALHIDSVVLVGWSLGAFDALAYLHQFGPDRVNALVLVDSPLAAPSGPAPAQRAPFLQRFQNDREHVGPDYIWSLFKKPLPGGLYKKLEEAEERVPTDIALSVLDNTRPGDAWEPSLSVLRQISILYAITPTYASQATYLQEVDPQARVETFENCGHALFVDESKRFNSVLRDFLKQSALFPPEIPTHRHHKPSPEQTPPSSPATGVMVPKPTPIPTPSAVLKPSPIPAQVPIPPHPKPSLTFKPSSIYTFTPQWTHTPKPIPTSTFTPMPSLPTPTFQATLPPTPKPVSRHPKKPFQAPAHPIQDGFFTTSDGVKLHYLEAGQGLPLVFIPGWLLPAEIWMPQLVDLSADYHVIALDPRSQGMSDMTPQGDEPKRQARDIQELLDHLQLSSVVLIGWSHGAFHVLSYLSEFGTDRLYAFGLVDSSLGAAAAPPAANTRQGKFLLEYEKNPGPALRGFIWSLFKTPPPADFTKELNQSALRTPPAIGVSLMDNIFPGEAWQPTIQTIRQIPLFYAITPKFTYQSDYLIQVDPLAHVEIFQNTGHALFVDDPVHFNNALRDFLRAAKRYPSGWFTISKPAATPRL
ncbi:MAG TPA: alpha/beta fold hydrolase [bacterium]|nr:alpha/beta fold hydrolase [bacterium]